MTGIAVMAGLAVVLLLVPSRGLGLKRLEPKANRATAAKNPWKICAAVCAAGAVTGVLASGLAVAATVGIIGSTIVWILVSRIRDKRAVRRREEVVRSAQILESLLALGHIPGSALALAGKECPVLEPAVAASGMGGRAWEVLEQMAQVPGQEGLAEIGRALKVSTVSGGSMRASLEQVRKNLEEAMDTAGIIAGELAGPRATGQILAFLPLVGLFIAFGIGADPVSFLTGSVLGRGCLLTGIGLACLGVIWSEILARQASGTGNAKRRRGRKKETR